MIPAQRYAYEGRAQPPGEPVYKLSYITDAARPEATPYRWKHPEHI
jgi:hypothetical protein